jgi:reverse gyrase
MFEKRVLKKILGRKRDKVTVRRRKLHALKFSNLYTSSRVTGLVKSRAIGWTGLVASMVEISANKMLVINREGRRSLARSRRR